MQRIAVTAFFICVFSVAAVAESVYTAATDTNIPHADSAAFQFSLGGNTGLLHSKVSEYVYRSNNDEFPLLSRLDWDIDALYFVEINSSIAWRGFFAYGSFSVGIPGSSGSMQDYDWNDSSSTTLTNYSTHNNTVTHYFAGHIRAGYHFEFRGNGAILKTGPVIGVTGSDFYQTASDGYFQYLTPSNGIYPTDISVYDLEHKAMSGEVVSYELQSILPLIGWTADFNCGRFSASFTTMISPHIHIDGFDTHIIRDVLYWDKMNGNFYLFVEAGIGWRLLRTFALGLNVQYESMSTADGSTMKKNLTTGTTFNVTDSYAGVMFSTVAVKLTFTYVIGK